MSKILLLCIIALFIAARVQDADVLGQHKAFCLCTFMVAGVIGFLALVAVGVKWMSNNV